MTGMLSRSRFALPALGLLCAMAASAAAQTAAPLAARPGWVVTPTPHAYGALVTRLEEAVKENKMAVVNAASASDGAKNAGFTIPGNRVVGVYRNDFARRMLAASVPAGIEAPVRIYVTENADGTATLSYRTPGSVFAPYFEGAGEDLRKVAAELDPLFEKIVADAAKK